MPTIPSNASLNRSSVDILNAIRNQASADYRNYVPEGTPSDSSIREIGSVIMDYPALQNEFLHGPAFPFTVSPIVTQDGISGNGCFCRKNNIC